MRLLLLEVFAALAVTRTIGSAAPAAPAASASPDERGPTSGLSLFPAARTRTLHFIRHAEGFHNVATKKHGDNTCLHRGSKPAPEHPLVRVVCVCVRVCAAGVRVRMRACA